MKMAIIYHCMLGKLNVSGSAFCIYCNEPSIYSNTDKKDLIKLVLKSEEYLPSKKDYLSTTLLPFHLMKMTCYSSSEINTYTPLVHEWAMPYGVAENVHTTATCLLLKENTWHHKHHLEAYVLSFVRENSLPILLLPKLIEFSLFLSRDLKALSQVQMN